MKNHQRGFIPLIIIVIVAIAAIGGGTYVYTNKKASLNVETNNLTSLQATSTVATTTTKASSTPKTNAAVNVQATTKVKVPEVSTNIDVEINTFQKPADFIIKSGLENITHKMTQLTNCDSLKTSTCSAPMAYYESKNGTNLVVRMFIESNSNLLNKEQFLSFVEKESGKSASDQKDEFNNSEVFIEEQSDLITYSWYSSGKVIVVGYEPKDKESKTSFEVLVKAYLSKYPSQ